MTFFNAVQMIISVVCQCSSLFALFYLFMIIKDKIRKPKSPYKITQAEHAEWCKNRMIIHSLLCILYALLFVMGLFSAVTGALIVIVLLLVVYVLRVKNNLKYVK